jgi:hypothetical protein
MTLTKLRGRPPPGNEAARRSHGGEAGPKASTTATAQQIEPEAVHCEPPVRACQKSGIWQPEAIDPEYDLLHRRAPRRLPQSAFDV